MIKQNESEVDNNMFLFQKFVPFNYYVKCVNVKTRHLLQCEMDLINSLANVDIFVRFTSVWFQIISTLVESIKMI